MKKHSCSKLALNRETLATLVSDALDHVAGGNAVLGRTVTRLSCELDRCTRTTDGTGTSSPIHTCLPSMPAATCVTK